MKPTLFIICGYVGTGKTTTAHKLSRLVKATVASVDEVLKRILDNPSFLKKDQPPSSQELILCYKTFALLSDYMLGAKKSIIIDGAFAKQWQRNLLLGIAKKRHASAYIIYITCPKNLIEQRTSQRFDQGKGVGFKAHLKIKKIFEPVTKKHFTVDTSKNVQKQLREFVHKYNLA